MGTEIQQGEQHEIMPTSNTASSRSTAFRGPRFLLVCGLLSFTWADSAYKYPPIYYNLEAVDGPIEFDKATGTFSSVSLSGGSNAPKRVTARQPQATGALTAEKESADLTDDTVQEATPTATKTKQQKSVAIKAKKAHASPAPPKQETHSRQRLMTRRRLGGTISHHVEQLSLLLEEMKR